MSYVTDAAIRDFVKSELPLVTTLLLKKINIEDRSTLQEVYEADDIADMAEKYFSQFDVKRSGFTLINYFPWRMKSLFSRKQINQDKKPLTIEMFIGSAKAGRWLYD
ncbi:DUF1493 family protein [Erwinia tracheiphila]|uniref:DUF1493 family protein n=1 Tax=Erwinia tracheiphila TaxID=65700 RepID=A0A345CSN3_9GAMM|nr:DUF1493 family protein [Erwinia tracheiphila]AXF76450.1 DUF1493 family protein [Erwinia tracheiphila]UIA84883.1 DUF1493 family protein [Erwinia tracheiphila]UIA93479.1 DUF1493 family protein [Erwinia tracheiphila]